MAKEDEIVNSLEEDGGETQEPEKKKPKLKIKLNLKKTPSTPESNEDTEKKPELKPSKKTKKQEINEFVEQVQNLFNSMREQIEESDGHSLTSIFEKLPSKREYPDYYAVIEKPVALDTIMRNAKKGTYKTMEDVRQELQQMYNNARFYNEEGSWVYNDAEALEQFTNKWFETA
mgnify:CR=1 FL=1